MNTLKAKVKHRGFYRSPIKEFNTIIDNSLITMSSQGDHLELVIKTRKKESDALSLFLDVFSLLFIYFGAFPTIETIEFNSGLIDTSQWVGKYTTRSDLFRHDLFIADVNAETINQTTINEYRNKQETAFFSLQYLVSKDYMHVISDHRITLLLHIIDGICEVDKNGIDSLKSEMILKYKLSTNKDSLGRYLTKVYAVSKECFFYYHRKYNCEILKLLRINQYTFLRMVADTRNWNSHFLRDKKTDRLKKGTEIIIFFELVQYMIRLKIARDIGVTIKEDNIKEYYYTVHDWILKELYNRDDDLKSKTYITGKQWDKFMEQMNQYIMVSKVASSASAQEV